MTDRTRPLAVGYLREHFLMTAGELARLRNQLVRFAAAEGLTLQRICVEKLETEPAAFQALVDIARQDEVSTVIVPSLQHLKSSPGEPSRREHLEHYAGVRMLIATASSP